MFGTVWNFLKRHRRKFLLTGVVIGGIYYAGKYARRKLQELQDIEAQECLSHARRQHHFDSNQRTCNMTVLSMLPNIREALMHQIDTEQLTEQLKTKPANKLDIWEELKIMSFTRTVTAVYSVSIMIVLLRVQLNIIGGYMYLDAVNTTKQNGMIEVSEDVVATPEVQGRYLAAVQYLVNDGLHDLITAVKKEVEKSVRKLNLKEQISMLKLQTVINHIRQEMEHKQHNGYYDGAGSRLCNFILPPEEETDQASQLSRQEIFYKKLMLETKDMTESGDFHAVLTACLDTSFNRLLDKIAEFYKPTKHTNGTVFSPNDISMPLAKVIPVMNGLIHTVCGDAPNPFVQELLLKGNIKNFAANIYEAFSQTEEQTPS